MRPEQSRCFVAARRAGLPYTSHLRKEPNPMLRRSCGVRYDGRVRPLSEGRVGLWLGACLVVAVLTVADRLHAAHFIVALGCFVQIDDFSTPPIQTV